MDNVIISNPFEFSRKKAALKQGGAQKLHVVADCDKTITKAHLHGEKRHSLVELIRKFKYLAPEYSARAYEFYNIYHPIETDPFIPLETKKEKMVEWWTKHVKWMGECGISKEVVQKIVREQEFGARDGLGEFVELLHRKNIPFLIFSASVTDMIEGFLKKEGWLHPNIHVVSNKYQFNDKGMVVGYESGIIHSYNKSEASIAHRPYFSDIHSRKNILLLGDTLDDVGMLEGSGYENVIKIGFLNDDVEKKLDAYQKAFDVVILNDGPMDFVNELLQEILSE